MSVPRPIYFDLETTGIRTDKDRIVEIAAFDPTRMTDFQRLVNPGIAIPHEASQIHGIQDGMVKDAIYVQQAAQEFIHFCGNDSIVLIAHNGDAFDIPLLAHEFTRVGMQFPHTWAFVDSLKWARKYRRDLPRHSLQYLRQIFEIPENRAHRALDDVYILHKVFSLLIDDLPFDEVISLIGGCNSLSHFTVNSAFKKGFDDPAKRATPHMSETTSELKLNLF